MKLIVLINLIILCSYVGRRFSGMIFWCSAIIMSMFDFQMVLENLKQPHEMATTTGETLLETDDWQAVVLRVDCPCHIGDI